GNLKEPENNFPFLKTLAMRTVPGVNVKVGVTNIIGPTVQENIKDPAVKFEKSDIALDGLLKQMRDAKVDLPILLYHGLATPRKDGKKEAINCAERYPQFPVIVCLSEEDEPPAGPQPVDHPKSGTRNYVFRLGHKGKNIGVLGVYRSGAGNAEFSFKYQLVEMGEEYMTPKEQEENHPIIQMMEDYTRELKDKNYLARYGQSKHFLQAMPEVAGLGNGKPTYIGSEGCRGCHRSAFKVWQNTPHSHAYKTLVDARRPSLRQYDGECIVCHTVGFGYNTGFTNEQQTPKLENVGCESCHGPGSLHAKNPQDEEWQKRMNQPWRGAKNADAKKLAIDHFCQTCHDIDNDVTWIHNAFPDKWKKIIHGKDKD
ncbi:MAG TPA: multiheme c-type cytochrome, partial [Gemmataceae bacterium]